MQQISKSRFKPRTLEYFRQMEADGSPVIVKNHGESTIRISGGHSAPADTLAQLRGSVLRHDAPLEPVALDDWDLLG